MEATLTPRCTTSHRRHHEHQARQFPKYDTSLCRLHRVGVTNSPVRMHREQLPPAAHSSLQINLLQTPDGADRTPALKQKNLPPPARSSRPHVMLPCWLFSSVSSTFRWIVRARQTCQGETMLMSTTIDQKWILHFPVPCRASSHRSRVGDARN